MIPPVRVVLDTNVLVSALLFSSGKLAWLRHAWASGQVIPLACRETVTELVAVLSYPKFRLDSAAQETLLGDFLPYVETVALPKRLPATPRCRDSCDEVFLALVICARADAIITGDADLLTLAREIAVPILTPGKFRESMGFE
jgi:putative PIN family toxin of toxin-antitoxin system